MHDSHSHTIINAITGISGGVFAVLTSYQEQLEFWIRVTGGMLGIAVALVSLLTLICKFIKNLK